MSKYNYEGYDLVANDSVHPPVCVYDSRFATDPAVYRTTSLDRAMRWVDAYVKGEQWAVEAKAS